MLKHLQLAYPNLKMGSYTHIVHSLHIYERHFDLVKQMLLKPFNHMSYPLMKNNLVTTKGDPTDRLNLLENSIILGDRKSFNDPLFKWLSDYALDI